MQPPFPCENKAKGVFYGYCAPGVDVYTCEESLKLQCAPEDIGNWFLDGCGGHARPYHHHNELSCYYDHSTNTHSPLVGIAKDGYGIYGIYEKDKQAPTDLDACNGHYGPVPELKISNYESTLSSTLDASGLLNTNQSAGTNVYHYHTTTDFPFTIGCYGPKTSSECAGGTLDGSDDQCGTGTDATVYIPTDGGQVQIEHPPNHGSYDTYCSCRYTKVGSGLTKTGEVLPIADSSSSSTNSAIGLSCHNIVHLLMIFACIMTNITLK